MLGAQTCATVPSFCVAAGDLGPHAYREGTRVPESAAQPHIALTREKIQSRVCLYHLISAALTQRRCLIVLLITLTTLPLSAGDTWALDTYIQESSARHTAHDVTEFPRTRSGAQPFPLALGSTMHFC